jgi:hypothetical protein
MKNKPAIVIDRIDASAYKIPTDFPEADGTYSWDHTVLVLVEAYGGGKKGVGFYPVQASGLNSKIQMQPDMQFRLSFCI